MGVNIECLSCNDYTLLRYVEFMNGTQVVNRKEHEFVCQLAQTSTKI